RIARHRTAMRIDDDGQPRPPPGRDADDVADMETLERLRGGCTTLRSTFTREHRLAFLQCAAKAGVLLEVAEMALHRPAVAVERLLVAAQLPGQPDDRAVRLELRERLLQQ